jgi:hypothetical protein
MGEGDKKLYCECTSQEKAFEEINGKGFDPDFVEKRKATLICYNVHENTAVQIS